MNPSDPTRVVAKVPTAPEAALVVATLADAGIKAVYNGTAIAGFAAEAPAMVRVLVDAADHERAATVLADQRANPEPIDWASVDVGQPE